MTAASIPGRRRQPAFGLLAAAILSVGCASTGERPEGLDPSALSEEIRGDYAIFARRCSKCHSLARPLDSGIDKDEYWAFYVERMRKQPASGISLDDVPPILRFLHYYSREQQHRHEAPADTNGTPSERPSPPTEVPDSAVAPRASSGRSPPGGPP